MTNIDLFIFAAHFAFWASLGIARRLARTDDADSDRGSAHLSVAAREDTAPYSRAVLAFHMLAFALMYFALFNAVLPNHVPLWFPGQRLVGVGVIAVGTVLGAWAIASFHSWRFRAKLEQGHQLATQGPFGILRHPIYMGLNLLALGSAIWVPSPLVWIGFILMVVGSDLRARSEESLLLRAFGSTYADYCARTRRFIPGLY